MSSIALFEAGPLVAALAKNSALFAIGRALSSVGFAGIVSDSVMFGTNLSLSMPSIMLMLIFRSVVLLRKQCRFTCAQYMLVCLVQ